MLKKIHKVKLTKKLIIIIISIFVFIAISLFLILKFFIRNDFYSYEMSYANDSKESLNTLYQEYEKSKATFLVYGEEVKGTNINMEVKCGEDITNVELSSKPITINNHCILTFNPKKYEEKFLTAYIVSPDTSLIAVKPSTKAVLQLNAYKKETRIVLEQGNIYNRIANQKKNNKYTIQVANTIFESNGGQEIGTVSKLIDSKALYTLEYTGLIKYGDKYFEKIQTTTVMGIASFQIVSGKSKYINRNDNTIVKYNNSLYYLNNNYNSLELDSNDIEGLKDLYGDYSDDLNDLVEEQDELNNNKKFHFTGIISDNYRVRDKDRTKKVMDEYANYWTKKLEENNNSEEENNDNEEENTNNKTACEIYKEISGYTPTDICWCRNDFSISNNSLSEINSKGYSYTKSDFIYCYTSIVEDSGSMGNSVEGYMLKECAIDLGWPEDSYSNQGGYVCN